MTKSTRALALAGTMSAILGAAPSAYAHQTYNVGTVNAAGTGWQYSVSAGYGNGVDGAINDSQHTGTAIDNNNLRWLSGTGAISPDWNGNLPEMWYAGMHTTATGVTNREIGSVSSATGTTFITPGSSLQARIAGYNGSAPAGLTLDPNSQIAVKGNSWLTGDGLDYGVTHVTCGTAAGCLTAGALELSWTFKNLNSTSSSLLGIAIYGGWDQSSTSDRTAAFNGNSNTLGNLDHPQGSSLGLGDLLYAGTMSTSSDTLFYHRLFNADEAAKYNGEYTVLIGALNNTGDGQYYLKVTTQAVPLPAAVWLFGSALAAMGVIGRRKQVAA